MTTLRTQLSVLALTATAFLLSGCNLQQSAPIAMQGEGFHGTVYGGQQPIVGATIQLYAAGSSGYGSAYPYTTGTSLLGSNVVQTTGPDGDFYITGDYICPSMSTEVYLVSTGGSPGLTGNAANPQATLMAALGPCGNLNPSTYISLNELTTVASVWSLSPFMTGITNIGTNATNATGLTNAFATVNKLVNIVSGTASGPALPANATLPVAKINTLANILASCINSAGGIAGDGSNCGVLFADTTVNGIAPTDTVTAALNLAQHPNLQTATLTALSNATAPFQPSLSTPPSDYSLVVTYTGGGLSAPKGIAVDNAGNVWTANSGNNSVTELNNTGAPMSGANGFTVGSLNLPAAIAIDASGDAWIANSGNNTVTEIQPLGASGIVFTGGNMSSPNGVAVDASSNIWIANAGNGSVTQISSGGTLTNYAGTGIASPKAIAINPK